MESSFSPRETVSELDKFIIGQKNDLPLENPVDDFGIFTESTE